MRVAEDLSVVLLREELYAMARHPLALLRQWNWKAAAVSALIRAGMFFAINLGAGGSQALKAMLVEAAYAIVAAGLAGAVTQRLPHAEPKLHTAAVAWVALPVAMLLAQAAVHHATGTPRLRSSMIASFPLAAVATGFNWFAMGKGAFVTGEGRSFGRDLLLLPKLLRQFLLALPRGIFSRFID